jgi:hypothetical protein
LEGDGTLKSTTNNILGAPELFYRLNIWINAPTNSTP